MRNAALVLSGGGCMGAAHIGALSVLEKHFRFDYLIGVSAGAMVGAALACGKSAAEISAFATSQKFFRLVFEPSRSKLGLIKGQKILELLDGFFEQRRFEDLPSGKRLLIAATDFVSGDQVLISSGNIAEAVRASIAVPLLFEPCFHQKKWLIDGGISQNFPLDIALRDYSGRFVLGVDVCSFFDDGHNLLDGKFGRIKTMKLMAERSLRILFKNQQRNFQSNSRAVIIRPDLSGFSPWDFKRLKAIETKGFEAASEVLSKHRFQKKQ